MPGKATKKQEEKKEQPKEEKPQTTETQPKESGRKKDKKDRKLKPRKEILKLPIFEKRSRNFGIGNNVQPKRNLARFVKWPAYVRLQRQKRILYSRLKVPPALNQFSRAVDKQTATQLLTLLNKYRPETKQAKKTRLAQVAAAKAKNEKVNIAVPLAVTFGLNSVTAAVEQKRAKLVVIAHDVDPIELVVWVPTLCRKLNVPYCIIKSKARLGTLVHRKNCSVVALTDVNKEDKNDLANLQSVLLNSYNNNADIRKQWGGGRLPNKHMELKSKREKAVGVGLHCRRACHRRYCQQILVLLVRHLDLPSRGAASAYSGP